VCVGISLVVDEVGGQLSWWTDVKDANQKFSYLLTYFELSSSTLLVQWQEQYPKTCHFPLRFSSGKSGGKTWDVKDTDLKFSYLLTSNYLLQHCWFSGRNDIKKNQHKIGHFGDFGIG